MFLQFLQFVAWGLIRMTKYWIRSDNGQLLSKWLNSAVTDIIKELLQELQSTLKLSIVRIF